MWNQFLPRIRGGGGGGQRRRLCKNLRSLSVCESESGESESGERGEGESVYVRVHRPLLQFQTAGETANLRHGLKKVEDSLLAKTGTFPGF